MTWAARDTLRSGGGCVEFLRQSAARSRLRGHRHGRRTRLPISPSLALLAMLMIGVLGLVAPTDRGRLDLHRGELFHPLIAHVHPEAPPESDGLAAAPSTGEPAIRGGHGAQAAGAVIGGELAPPIEVTPHSLPTLARLTPTAGLIPVGFIATPVAPPPESA